MYSQEHNFQIGPESRVAYPSISKRSLQHVDDELIFRLDWFIWFKLSRPISREMILKTFELFRLKAPARELKIEGYLFSVGKLKYTGLNIIALIVLCSPSMRMPGISRY